MPARACIAYFDTILRAFFGWKRVASCAGELSLVKRSGWRRAQTPSFHCALRMSGFVRYRMVAGFEPEGVFGRPALGGKWLIANLAGQ